MTSSAAVVGERARCRPRPRAGRRHRELAEVRAHRRGEGRGRGPTGRRERSGRRLGARSRRSARATSSSAARASKPSSSARRVRASRREARATSTSVSPYLRRELAQQPSARAHVLQADRVVGDGLDREAQLALEVGELGLCRAQSLVESRERVSVRERSDGRARPRPARRLSIAAERLGERVAVRRRRRRAAPPRPRARRPRSGRRRPASVDLARSGTRSRSISRARGARVAAERLRAPRRGPASRARAARSACERLERGRAREAVERAALDGRCEQRLVVVLTVQVDEARAELGELSDGREPAVDVGARPPVARHDTRPARPRRRRVDEPAFDARLVGTVAHERRVGPSAEQQVERLDEQRLARAGLAR